ncbi:MAG TPA: hypothetical protein VK762_02660 [Polyangiaceae bacterium]|jgi:hypothetical protein|nr:hypothetical protein [Polyangiaceae bacterium]
MAARLRSWTHRHLRAAALLFAAGCLSTGSGSGGCDQNDALGQGSFSYACPAPAAADPSTPSPDALCASDALVSLGGSLPDVAVGAPFSLQFGGASGQAPQPAVPSLAQSAPGGWSLTQPGWLGFVVWSGSDVVDFTHVHAQAIASVHLGPALPATSVPVGFVADLAVTPLGADGTVLGGAVSCTFSTSDPTVLSAQSRSGRVVAITALAAGDATVAASCSGASAQVSVRVSSSPDGRGADEAGADAGTDADEKADSDADDADDGG